MPKVGNKTPKKRKEKAIVLNKSHLLSSILISEDLQSQKSYPECQLVFGGVSWTCQFMFHPQWN
jgi:hypothetical protein